MMDQKNKTNNGVKYGSLIFLAFMVFSVFYSLYKTKTTDDKVGAVEFKVDSRFTSYDNLFFQSNSVVVDSFGNIIGEVYILTNDREINKFYSDSTRRKTKYYHNLINRKLKIKEQ